MSEKIKAARQQLGGFFKERRLQMGRTTQELADFVGISVNTLNGIESGRFAWDVDLNNRLCAALEIKPFFAPLELIGGGTLPSSDPSGKFLFAPDDQDLFILHRQFPACLIQILQTTPVTFRIVDLYDKIDESELVMHPFLEEAKKFWRDHINKHNNEN